jgi:hypothetical protein
MLCQVAHVFALAAYDLDYGDHSLAAAHFEVATNYSMLDLFEKSTDGLVHGTPRPIIDWRVIESRLATRRRELVRNAFLSFAGRARRRSTSAARARPSATATTRARR